MNEQRDIRTLTKRFFDGETTLHEESILYRLYAEGDIPADLIANRDVILGLRAIEHYPKSPTNVSPPHFHLPSKFLAAAACLLLLVAWGVWHYRSLGDECVAYVYGERITDEEVVMQELQLAIGSLSDDGASDAVETQLKDLFE